MKSENSLDRYLARKAKEESQSSAPPPSRPGLLPALLTATIILVVAGIGAGIFVFHLYKQKPSDSRERLSVSRESSDQPDRRPGDRNARPPFPPNNSQREAPAPDAASAQADQFTPLPFVSIDSVQELPLLEPLSAQSDQPPETSTERSTPSAPPAPGGASTEPK